MLSSFRVQHFIAGLMLMSLGPIWGGWMWITFWPGLCNFWVSLAYFREDHRVFGKRSFDGSIPRIHRLILFPYFFVAFTLWRVKSLLRNEAPFHEVAKGIYVGRRPTSLRGIPKDAKTVVDFTAEFPRSYFVPLTSRYLAYPTLDTLAPSRADLLEMLTALEGEEAPVFFHCAVGRGRSATGAAALLLQRHPDKSVEDIEAMMRAARSGIRLHAGQRQRLREIFRSDVTSTPS